MNVYGMFAVPTVSPVSIGTAITIGCLALGVLALTGLSVIVLRPYVPSWFTYCLGCILLGIIGSRSLDYAWQSSTYALVGSLPVFLADVYPFSEWSLDRVTYWILYSRRDRTRAMLEAIQRSARDELVQTEYLIMHDAHREDYRWSKLRRFVASSLAVLLTVSYHVAAFRRFGPIGSAFMMANLMIPLLMIIIGNPLTWLREMISAAAGGPPPKRGLFVAVCGWIGLLGLMLAGDFLVNTFLPSIKSLLS